MAIDLQPGGSALEATHFTTGVNPSLVAHISPPFTFFARVKLNAGPGALGSCIIKIDRIPPGFLSGNFFWHTLIVRSPDQFLAAQSRQFGADNTGSSISVTPMVIGTWHNVAGVFRSTTFRQVWLDGVSGPANTVESSPSGLEGLLIGNSFTSTGSYNRPLTACLQDITCWRRELTGAEIVSLNTLEDVTSLHQTDIFFHVPFDDEATATVAWDYTSGVPVAVPLFEDGSAGSVTTCNDSPEFPEEPDEECIGEDEADEVPTVTVTWPVCDLVPEDIDVQAVSETSSPGRALSGRKQIVQRAAGHWRIELIGIPVWTKERALQWHEIESKLDGRNGTALVPFYEGKLSATPIAATMAGEFGIGDVRVAITQTAGASIRAGMHFSTSERGYRIKRRLSDDIDGNAQVIVWPPLRDVIAAGAALDFNAPTVRCRLERDDGMSMMLGHLKFGKNTVAFLEDV